MTFGGFPSRPRSTAIPNVFFSDVLPQLTDPAALAVVLHVFCLLGNKRGFPRYITAAELDAEPALQAYLRALDRAHDCSDVTSIEAGLRRAVALGVLLELTVERGSAPVSLFFLNAPADRRAMESARAGGIDLGPIVRPAAAQAAAPSSVFALYESLIGTISPLISDELTEAERLYPAEWLQDAFREAAAQNARSWRYVSRILERWAIEGRDHAKTDGDPEAGGRYFAGKYGGILKRRLTS